MAYLVFSTILYLTSYPLLTATRKFDDYVIGVFCSNFICVPLLYLDLYPTKMDHLNGKLIGLEYVLVDILT